MVFFAGCRISFIMAFLAILWIGTSQGLDTFGRLENIAKGIGAAHLIRLHFWQPNENAKSRGAKLPNGIFHTIHPANLRKVSIQSPTD